MIFSVSFGISEKRIDNLAHHLSALPTPPEHIGIFGDTPWAGCRHEKIIPAKMILILKQKYKENGNSWDFI